MLKNAVGEKSKFGKKMVYTKGQKLDSEENNCGKGMEIYFGLQPLSDHRHLGKLLRCSQLSHITICFSLEVGQLKAS